MIVVCTSKNIYTKYLTIGKSYDVTPEAGGYRFINDAGHYMYYPTIRFVSIDVWREYQIKTILE